jgi:SAM-dependent methyltransferase
MDHEPGPVSDPYHHIGTLYDLEHDAFLDDVELILRLAESSGGMVLEMGCGTGRILAQLAASDIDVVGIDMSEPMLARARSRLVREVAERHVRLVRADMLDPGPVQGEPFGLVAFTLNALMHLTSGEDQLRALEAAAALLRPGGTLYLDLANPTPDYLVTLGAAPIVEWSGTRADGSCVDKIAYRTIDPVSQEISTILWYDQVSPAGDFSRVRSAFSLRYLHVHELRLMLEQAGFQDIAFHGSYELDALTGSSDRMIVLARTPDEPLTESPEH